MTDHVPEAARPRGSGRLFVYNGGFLARRLRRIIGLTGWRLTTGRPGPDDHVAVWGRSPTAHRGEAMAQSGSAGLIRVEDAFLRSIRTGRDGEAPLGLMLDPTGVHFDSSVPSALELLLARHPLDDSALMARARAGMARMQALHLSKYNAFDPDIDVPPAGYVLVVDQTAGDASILHGKAQAATFREMLAFAQIEHPGSRILIKTHPETVAGHRTGHFGPDNEDDRTRLFSEPVSPWALLEGAVAVYTVSSQLGFEAILAGHRPRVFGQPWYGGWGLTQDENPVPRRERRLTRAQAFAAAMILAPVWYDPCRDRLCSFEDALDLMEARVRAFRADRRGYVAAGMRLWKRAPLQRFFGTEQRLSFCDDPEQAAETAEAKGAPVMVWAGKATDALDAATARRHVPLIRVEDGLLRSRGLGAELVPPLSLVTDDLGIYYDPEQESRLERLIAESTDLPEDARRRAERLIGHLIAAGLTKYNLGGSAPDLPAGRRILVPGQVEDDASIRLGCGEIRTNLGLLKATRAANPDAVILYKPHPDVEAGLRTGTVSRGDLDGLADAVLPRSDPALLLDQVETVWTLTSGLGFEALIRGVSVTCLGAPFYAGWGLTTDVGPVPARREARPDLVALVHAALIAYPRYRDPVSGLACPVEVVVERLATGRAARRGPVNRILAKAQGLAAGLGPFWR